MYGVTTDGKRTKVELIAAQPRGKNVLRQRAETSGTEDVDEEDSTTTKELGRGRTSNNTRIPRDALEPSIEEKKNRRDDKGTLQLSLQHRKLKGVER